MEVKPKKKKPVQHDESEIPPRRLIAQRNFTIAWNDYFREIKKGEDLSDIPAEFIPNLYTEGVIL